MSADATEQIALPLINSVESTQQNELDEHAMKSVLRKVDIRLMPLLTLLYFFSFLDRINIGIVYTLVDLVKTLDLYLFFEGNARLFGLQNDINLSSSEYDWAVSIFFISYVSNDSIFRSIHLYTKAQIDLRINVCISTL